MRYTPWSKRDPVTNCFQLPNEIFVPGLSPGALAVYSYLLCFENRNTCQCWPSCKTIGSPTDIAQGNTSGGYTEVTDDLRYSDGSLGTLKIPVIDLTVKVCQGTDSAALKKGAGHFTNTSIWDGNACFAGHNRGVNDHFGKSALCSLTICVEICNKTGRISWKSELYA